MNITYGMYGITDLHKQEVKQLVEKNVAIKMDSYLLPYKQKVSSLVVKIEKNKRNKYDGIVRLTVDAKMLIYKTHGDGFRIIADIINHAFDRFKEQLAHK